MKVSHYLLGTGPPNVIRHLSPPVMALRNKAKQRKSAGFPLYCSHWLSPRLSLPMHTVN